MSKKEKIIKLYYEDNLKIIDIVNIVNVSRAYISKIIKTDTRYYEKREKQKEATRKKKREYTNSKMKEIRDNKAQEDGAIKQQHIQAIRELSGGNSIIGNRALLKWNSSAYKYNSSKERYEFDKKLNKSYAMPKYIKL